MAISIFGTKANNTDIVVKDTGTGAVDLGSGNITTTGTITGNAITGNGSSITNLAAANLTGSLPAISGGSLTGLTAANLTGALPAIDGSSLTGISSIGTIVKIAADEITATTSGSGGFSNTGLEVTITPSSTSNKILLFTTGSIGTDKNTLAARFVQGSTGTGLGDPNGSRLRVSFKIRGPHDNNHSALFSGSCILSPTTTSTLTYRVQFQAESSGTWYLNRNTSFNNSSDASHAVSSSYLYAIELDSSNTTIST